MMISIKVDYFLFKFTSHEDWETEACKCFEEAKKVYGLCSHQVLCIDELGMVCTSGAAFKVAKYPVKAFKLDLAGNRWRKIGYENKFKDNK